MAFPTYPAVTYEQAIQSAIFTSNQIHEVLNGSNTATVDAVDGPILTVRHALQNILDLGGNQYKAIFTDQNIASADAFRTYMVDVSAVPLSVTLPAGATEGQYVQVMDYKSNSNTNNITVDTEDAALIDGLATYTLASDGYLVGFWRDPTEWHAIVANAAAAPREVRYFPTVSSAKADSSLLDGQVVHIKGRPAPYVYDAAGTATDDGGAYLALDTLPGRLVAQISGYVSIFQYGVKGDGIASAAEQTAFQAAHNFADSLDIPLDLEGRTVALNSNFTMNVESEIRNGAIKCKAGAEFFVSAVCNLRDMFIDANGNNYAVQETVTPFVTNGMKRGLLYKVRAGNSLISDFKLGGYHFLGRFEQCEAVSNSSGFGFDISNVDGTLNPDIVLINCYVDGPAKGYSLKDGSYHLIGCSADGTSQPLSQTNSFVIADSCGFEVMTGGIAVISSQLLLRQCTIATSTGVFADDAGNRAFISCSGGTVVGSVEVVGGLIQNNSPNPVAGIRVQAGDDPTPARAIIRRDVDIREVVSTIPKFIYQSNGSPSNDLAKITQFGESKTYTQFSGNASATSADFELHVGKDTEEYVIPKNGQIRMIEWREVGAQTAGATTTVNMDIYNSDGTLRLSVGSVISIPGVGAGDPKRSGAKIIDQDVIAGEYIIFNIGSAGQRIDTGFSITMSFDS